MTPRTWRWTLALTAVCAAVACSDLDLAQPSRIAGDLKPSLSTSVESAEVVSILKRTENLPSTSVTKTIDPRGGHIQINRAGLRVEFAPGAVTVPTPITVTALSGRNVAYQFEPHGLVFAAPVTVRQSLRQTTAWRNPDLASQLQGSYFDRLVVDLTQSYARSKERRPAKLHDTGRMLEFTIEHFSGYMVSTGKVSIEIDVDIEIVVR